MGESVTECSSRGLLHQLMVELLYPAVLGAILYSYLDVFNYAVYVVFPLTSPITVLALLLHFSVDYLYVRSAKRYALSTFLIDVGILVLLYWTFQLVNLRQLRFDHLVAARNLSGFYILFLGWDIILLRKQDYFPLLFSYNLLFMAIFAVAWRQGWSPALLTTVILIATFLRWLFVKQCSLIYSLLKMLN
jgi:hypothetical protein